MSLALYRTYRPGRLADVIGQEHVTEPLGRALDAGKAHHAYLFTGPRGCGKTSTARILARSLNCEQGPTSNPCGVCVSCVDLAPNGSGSIDVLEIDAASHRGIEDARELREKAMYAPAMSPYRIYIIDEAHQLTTDAANALLKLIEEPPPHLKFVFATTEPDKILPTIRSRTHHYPFRLVSGRRLQEHLAWVCDQEAVPADPMALAMVAKAAGGSVRDSLSILGQMVAGAGPDGVTYSAAVTQLGLTDWLLVDQVISAIADSDGPSLFSVIDRVVDAGLDPRRFAFDLLERLRDLIVLHEIPDAAASGLVDLPDEQLATMADKVGRLSLVQLSRAADLVNAGLTDLKGATAPRLQLELLGARLLLPMSDDVSLLARLEQLERRATSAAPTPNASSTSGITAPLAPTPPISTSAAPRQSASSSVASNSAASNSSAPTPPAPPKLSSVAPSTASRTPAPSAVTPAPEPAAPTPVDPAGSVSTGAEVALDISAILTMWPAVLDALKASSRVAHTLAEGSAPVSRTAKGLVIAHPDKVRMDILRSNKGHVEHLRIAILDVVRIDTDVDFTHNPDPAVPAAQPVAEPVPTVEDSAPKKSARERIADQVKEEVPPTEDVAAADDADLDDSGLSGLALIQRELGGTVMTEYEND